jgi:hypothetical protein
VSTNSAYSVVYRSESAGFSCATRVSFFRNSGSFVRGWLYPMGFDAKNVQKSRCSWPVRASWSHAPWLFS